MSTANGNGHTPRRNGIHSNEKPRLVIFGDDWGRLPSSAQHLMRHLQNRFHIDWVNTIGSRTPKLAIRDIRRAAQKISAWLRIHRSDQDGPVVHEPWMWPRFGSAIERRVNRGLLERQLARVLLGHPRPFAVITTHPLVADLAERTKHLNWVYYCVDAYDSWPGLDHDTLRSMEAELLASGCRTIASSKLLVDRLTAAGYPTRELTHGVDLEHWSQPGNGTRNGHSNGADNGHSSGRTTGLSSGLPDNKSRSLAAPQGPRALFFGNIDSRLDTRFCLAIADKMELVLLGPKTEMADELEAHPRILWHGQVDYDDLPAHVADASVLVMPYADLPVTRAMQPLKLNEYLASGKPVVCTPLPANLRWEDAMDLSDDPAEFAAVALRRATESLPEGHATARLRLDQETWECKARDFARWIAPPDKTTVLNVRICRGSGAGPERLVLPMSRYSADSPFREIAAYLHDPEDKEFKRVIEEAERYDTDLHCIPDHGPLDRSVIQALADLCRKENVQIWHGHDYKSNLIGLLLRNRLGLRLVSTVHGWVNHTKRTPLYYAIDRHCLRRYDEVIAVSGALLETCKSVGIPGERLHCVTSAVDTDRFAGYRTREATGSKIVIAGLGRLEDEKGFDLLIDVVDRLIDSGLDLELRIAGEGSMRPRLEQLVRITRRTDRIQLVGYVADIEGFLSEADIYALPSRREGLPVSLLEAMAMSRPIVAARAGGVPEAIEDGVHGLLIDISDRSGLERSIRSLATDPELRARLGAAAKTRCAEMYGLPVRAARIHEVYRRALETE